MLLAVAQALAASTGSAKSPSGCSISAPITTGDTPDRLAKPTASSVCPWRRASHPSFSRHTGMCPGVLNSWPSNSFACVVSILVENTSLVNSANLLVVKLRSLSVIPVYVSR